MTLADFNIRWSRASRKSETCWRGHGTCRVSHRTYSTGLQTSSRKYTRCSMGRRAEYCTPEAMLWTTEHLRWTTDLGFRPVVQVSMGHQTHNAPLPCPMSYKASYEGYRPCVTCRKTCSIRQFLRNIVVFCGLLNMSAWTTKQRSWAVKRVVCTTKRSLMDYRTCSMAHTTCSMPHWSCPTSKFCSLEHVVQAIAQVAWTAEQNRWALEYVLRAIEHLLWTIEYMLPAMGLAIALWAKEHVRRAIDWP